MPYFLTTTKRCCYCLRLSTPWKKTVHLGLPDICSVKIISEPWPKKEDWTLLRDGGRTLENQIFEPNRNPKQTVQIPQCRQLPSNSWGTNGNKTEKVRTRAFISTFASTWIASCGGINAWLWLLSANHPSKISQWHDSAFFKNPNEVFTQLCNIANIKLKQLGYWKHGHSMY